MEMVAFLSRFGDSGRDWGLGEGGTPESDFRPELVG